MRDLSQTNIITKKKSFINIFRINLFLTGLVLALGLVYLFSINVMATQGFKIKHLSSQLDQLQADRRILELQNSEAQSVSSIEELSHKMNFVPATAVTYIKDDNFALK